MPSSKYWIGGATAAAQVDTLTLGGTWENNDVLNITLASADGATTQTLSVVSGSTVIATIATTVANAFNAAATGGSAAYSLFAGITAAAGATTVTLTAAAAGVPFTCTVTTTETGGGASDGQTFSRAATIASAGPNDWNTAGNWSDGVVPVATDVILIDSRGASYSILYGLNQNSITLGSLEINLGFTGNVGSLTTRLRISATLFIYGRVPPDGSSSSGSTLINIDLGSVASTVLVDSTRNTGTSGLPPLVIKGTHASNTLTIQGNAYVGVAVAVPGEASTFATILNASSGSLTLGSNVTLTNVTHTGSGKTTTNSAIGGTLKCTAGTVVTYGAVLIATIDAQGGTMYLNHRAAAGDSISTLQMNGATVDVRQDARGLTINATTWSGGKIIANSASQITHTAVTLAYTENSAGAFLVPA